MRSNLSFSYPLPLKALLATICTFVSHYTANTGPTQTGRYSGEFANIPFVSHCKSFFPSPSLFRQQSSTVKLDMAEYRLRRGCKYNCKVPGAFHLERTRGGLQAECGKGTTLAASETPSQPLLQQASIALLQQEQFLIPTPVHAWIHILPFPSFPRSSFSHERNFRKA